MIICIYPIATRKGRIENAPVRIAVGVAFSHPVRMQFLYRSYIADIRTI